VSEDRGTDATEPAAPGALQVGAPRSRSGWVDRDELARLEEERSYLLRSLEDLDGELAAGDLNDDDFATLRTGYESRLAEVLEELDGGHTALQDERRRSGPRRGRVVLTTVSVGVFAVVAGVLLANASGSRSPGGVITGSSPDDGSAEGCLRISLREPEEGIACFDDVLADAPDDVVALTYQGWAKVRSGDVAGGSAQFDRVVALDPGYPDVRVFRAAVAKDAGDFALAQAELEELYALDPPPALLSTMRSMNLESTVALGLLAPDTAECWTKLSAALDELAALEATAESEIEQASAAAVADLLLSAECAEGVLAGRPDELDALVVKGLALGVLDETSAERGLAALDRALVVDPSFPDALLVRSGILAKLGRYEAARMDLDSLADRRTSALLDKFDREAIRAQVENGLRGAGPS